MSEKSPAPVVTPRMVAEPISREHFALIHRLHSDPRVMRTLSPDGDVMTEEVTRKHLERCVDHWDRHGFGLWVFHAKSDGQFIGRGGLMVYAIDSQEVVGLAYAVIPDFWGCGFGTEMAAASLQFGFEQLELSELASWTLPINRASQCIMQNLGFHYESDFPFAGLTHRFYRLTAEAWTERR